MVASSIPGMSGEPLDSKKFAIVFVPAAEFQETEQLVNFGPFLVDSAQLGFWSRVLWAAPFAGLLLVLLIVLILRADWRQALLQRMGLRRSTRTSMPVRA
jgi:type III secretion protein J